VALHRISMRRLVSRNSREIVPMVARVCIKKHCILNVALHLPRNNAFEIE